MEYRDVTAFINKAKKFGSRLDLIRIKKLCELLGHPEEKCRFVHIAGTNGKGSASIFIENILARAGYKTGLYTYIILMSGFKLTMFLYLTKASLALSNR